MKVLKKISAFINDNPIIRHIILGVCGIIVFVFFTSIMLNLFTRHNKSKAVPLFTEMSFEQAKQVAKKTGLNLEIMDSLYAPGYAGGVIIDQLPKAGTAVKSGRRILLTVNSHNQRMVEIPYVAGYSLRQAKNILEVKQLGIDRLIFREDIAANNVLEQQYNGKVINSNTKLQAEVGSGVTLIVGTNSEATAPITPKLVGLTLTDAKSRLWEAGLNVGSVDFEQDISLLNRNEARVYTQVPEQGTRVTPGTTANIKLTLDGDKVEKGSISSDNAAKRIITIQDAETANEQDEQADQ